jgi:hypothetical protein
MSYFSQWFEKFDDFVVFELWAICRSQIPTSTYPFEIDPILTGVLLFKDLIVSHSKFDLFNLIPYSVYSHTTLV